MPIPEAFEFRGGSHDGERQEPPSPPPETLFLITTADGEKYARSGEEFQDETGIRRAVFRFDADGTGTAEARRRFSGMPSPGD